MVGVTNTLPSNKEEVINKKQELINKKEEVVVKSKDVVITKENIIPKSKDGAADTNDGEGFETIIKIFEENVHAITPLIYEKILDFTKHVSDKVIIMAINEAIDYNVKTIKYISKVLNSWISKGIKTVEQVIAYQNNWTSSNSIINNNSGSRSVKAGSFCDYEQRTYDFNLLEKQLLGIV